MADIEINIDATALDSVLDEVRSLVAEDMPILLQRRMNLLTKYPSRGFEIGWSRGGPRVEPSAALNEFVADLRTWRNDSA